MWGSLHYVTQTVTAVDDERVVISFGGAASNNVRDLNGILGCICDYSQTQFCIFLFSIVYCVIVCYA